MSILITTDRNPNPPGKVKKGRFQRLCADFYSRVHALFISNGRDLEQQSWFSVSQHGMHMQEDAGQGAAADPLGV